MKTTVKTIRNTSLLLAGLAIIGFGCLYFFKGDSQWAQERLLKPILGVLTSPLKKPIFFIIVPLIFLLEFLFPIDPSQKPFKRRGLYQDMVWFLITNFFTAAILVIYVDFLTAIYNRYFSFLTIHAIGNFPHALRFLWGILLADFFAWLNHYLRHKVDWLWQFHMVHHSQRELNLFTDSRYHIVEYIISRTIKVFPMLMLSVNTPAIIYYTIFLKWYPRFYHSNAKINLGPLRHILVTPQYHRIHHSREARHYDTNFATLFTIWDRLFRTFSKDATSYPEVGLEDSAFPHELQEKGLFGFIKTTFLQFIFPFKAIGIRLLKK